MHRLQAYGETLCPVANSIQHMHDPVSLQVICGEAEYLLLGLKIKALMPFIQHNWLKQGVSEVLEW